MNSSLDSKRTISQILSILAYSILASAVILLITVLYWESQKPQVLVTHNMPFPVRPPANKSGNAEYVHLNYCKTYKANGVVVARLVGQKSIIRFQWPNDTTPVGCLDTEIPVVIPLYAGDDTYYIDFTVTYQINPLKTETVDLKSQTFTVDSKLQMVP